MNANTCNDTDPRDFGPVRIGWTCGIHGLSCAVRVSWQEQLIATATLDRQRPRLDFSIRTEAAPYQRVSGALLFDPDNSTLSLLHLSYPGGGTGEELLGRCKPLPPPPTPPTEDETEVEQAIISEAGNLFPYIYLRAWPAATAQALADRFIFYCSDCVLDDPRLYCQLAAIDQSQPGARAAMIEQALLFVQDQSPYVGQFADTPAALGPDFVALAEFAVLAGQWKLPTPQALIGLIVTLWGEPWPVIVEVLQSKEFGKRLDRAWQNVFALNCVLGYDRGTLAGMIRVIVAAHLLQRLAEGPTPEALEIEWTPERLSDGLRATLVLPSPVFPLPCALPEIADEGEPLSILPYAIGDLHLVKRRLLGYALGEVSHVESVMADEKKLRAQHELIDDETRKADQSQSEVAHDDARMGSGSSFDAQVQNTLREQFQVDYTTNYGPPQEAKQSGSYTLTPIDQPTGESKSRQVDLARRITQRAAQRVSNSLSEQRLHHRRHARQSEVSQCFDRRGRNENQRGIYRWLDARYRCWVVRVGRRLMLEFFVPRPAERLIAAQSELSGIDLSEPVPPTQLGVNQFEDISLDPTSERYYAALAARYGVDAVEPPPPELAYACAVFEAGSPLLSQVMSLPEGYAAASATLSLATVVAGITAQGRIGASAFTVTGDGVDGAQTIALAEQTHSLPIAAAISVSPSNTADDTSAENYYGLNVEVELQRTPFALAHWKSNLYGQLLDGYRWQRASYLQAAGVTATPGLNPLAWQRIIRREIKRAGLRGFLRLAARRTGELTREMRFAPALRLWLDQALEWSEMTYTLIDDLETTSAPLRQVVSGDGEQFTEFLQAAHVRVLLPVAPACEQALVYFLASGMVWNGEDTLAPTFDTPLEDGGKGPPPTARYLDLVDDLKSAAPMLAPTCAQDSWALTLPTTMSVLQDGDRLPEFPERP